MGDIYKRSTTHLQDMMTFDVEDVFRWTTTSTRFPAASKSSPFSHMFLFTIQITFINKLFRAKPLPSRHLRIHYPRDNNYPIMLGTLINSD